ncbi:MAG: hypothetical protein ABI643_04060 [Candidatus Doudnabacteria bacterium]
MNKLVVLFILMAAPVSAQTFVESQNLMSRSAVVPTIDAQLEVPGQKVNAFGWFVASQGWGEGLLGVSKNVTPWLWASIAAGVETDVHPWRVSPSVVVSRGRVTIFGTTEHGGSGFWYKSVGAVRLTSRIEVGYHTQRFYGTGPIVRVNLNQKFSVWGSVVKGPQASIGIAKAF